MTLSDADLKKALANGELSIDPLDDPDLIIQPASIDLSLGDSFAYWPTQSDGSTIDMSSGREHYPPLTKATEHAQGTGFILPAGRFALAKTREKVRLSASLCARVEGRSSIGRLGLMVHATAGFIDPGFEGNITLELFNLSPHRIILHPGQSICQLAVSSMSSPAERPYGIGRDSKYQGQTDVTSSRWRVAKKVDADT